MVGVKHERARMLDPRDFVHATSSYRRELLAHCYRMLGSVEDAEDLVQETYLRAWRSFTGFEGRSTTRTWLYGITTNACLRELENRRRRVLPSALGPPASDPSAAPVAAPPGVAWLEPIPDELVLGALAEDPAAVTIARESLRLALIASLQYLPARQRAVLLLRDVLAFRAAEVAAMLDTSTAAVKSTLQRARAKLEQTRPVAEHITELDEPQQRALLQRYISAFEDANPAALQQLLCDEATLEATPKGTWLSGKAHCVPFLAAHVFTAPGYWRMTPTYLNGQPAAIASCRTLDGTFSPYGAVVLTISGARIGAMHSFATPDLAATLTNPIYRNRLPLRDAEQVSAA